MWIFLTIGRGPPECQIACATLVPKLCDEARQHGITPAILEYQTGEHGLCSALIALEGDGVESFMTSWEGTIQWTCPSPVRKSWKRKNWFISANAIRPPSRQVFSESDIRFDTYRSSGPGGQHVQKTDSAVRVTHIPTGLTAQAQEERSQHRNKALALARLATIFEQRNQEAQNAVRNEQWSRHDALERGNPIRVYRGIGFK